MHINDFYLDHYDENTILASVKKYGLAVVKNYVHGDLLLQLSSEFNHVFQSENPDQIHCNISHHPTNKHGWVARFKYCDLNEELFPAIKSIFSSSAMERVAKEYFSPYRYALNEDIFLTHEKPSENPILPWHIDRIQSLKFYLYLQDTSQKEGAFEYVPGSQREGRIRANYYIAQGVDIEEIPNDIPDEEIIFPHTIEGTAGTLLIFDPDGYHRGGIVSNGAERKVIRGHTYLKPDRLYGCTRHLPDDLRQIEDEGNRLVQYRIEHFGRALNPEYDSKAITRDKNRWIKKDSKEEA